MTKASDVSRDKAVDTNLVGTDELSRLLLNHTGEGIYGIDLKGNCTFANPACLEILGFESDEDVLGKNMHNLVHHTRPNGEPYPEKECRIYQALKQDEGTHVDDEVLFRADGTSFPTEYWSYPVWKEGTRVGCVVTFVDITERRRVEKELQETYDLVRLLMESTGEGLYGIDLEGNCTFANPACLRLLGFENDSQVLGRNMHDLVHHTRPDGTPYPEKECRIFQALRQDQGTHVDDELLFRADGSSFPVEYWSFPMWREGVRVGCVVTFVDISERRRVEEELRQTEKMAALGKLSAGLAHELNNPAAAAQRAAGQVTDAIDQLQNSTIELASLGLAGETWKFLLDKVAQLRKRSEEPLGLSALERSDREEELSEWLENREVADAWEVAPTLVAASAVTEDLDSIAESVPSELLPAVMTWLCRALGAYDLASVVMRSTKGISDLVNVVKNYSYMDQASLQYVDIHAGIEDTLAILHHKLKKGVEVVREYDREIPKIQVYASELNQVWTNLIDNAIGAMDNSGTITIRTRQRDGRIIVEIADDGPGIPEEIQARIFDPFFTTKEVGEGTGLGLDVARRVVTRRCGGQIDFESTSAGTTFTVQIPIIAVQPGKDGSTDQ